MTCVGEPEWTGEPGRRHGQVAAGSERDADRKQPLVGRELPPGEQTEPAIRPQRPDDITQAEPAWDALEEIDRHAQALAGSSRVPMVTAVSARGEAATRPE